MRFPITSRSCTGKSSLLAVLANKEVEIPDHIDTFLLRREMSPSEKTALQCVIEVDEERHRLESEVEDICHRGDNGEEVDRDLAIAVAILCMTSCLGCELCIATIIVTYIFGWIAFYSV